MSKRLVRLPDGTWVDPHLITIVEAKPADRNAVTGEGDGTRVTVHLTTGQTLIFRCTTFAIAEELRDVIVDAVNVRDDE